LGYRASDKEIARSLPISIDNKHKGWLGKIIPGRKNIKQVGEFVADLNYNLCLKKKTPVTLLPDRVKRTQDRYINTIEALEVYGIGIATSDVGRVLEVSPRVVQNTCAKIDFKRLNRQRKAAGLIPLIGLNNSQFSQEDIVSALEDMGGVATIRQIAEYKGLNLRFTRDVIAKMDSPLINQIRVHYRLYPLAIAYRSNDRNRKNIRQSMLENRDVTRGSEQAEIIKQSRIRYRQVFGKMGLSNFSIFTIPFAFSTVYRNNGRNGENGKAKRQRTDTENEWLHNIFQRVLEVVINYARKNKLAAAGRTVCGRMLQNLPLCNFFQFIVPRALNISREVLSKVDVAKINPLVVNDNRRIRNAIPVEEEEHMAAFLNNLDVVQEQTDSGQFTFGQSTIVFDPKERVCLARGKYVEICERQKEKFEAVKREYLLSSSPAIALDSTFPEIYNAGLIPIDLINEATSRAQGIEIIRDRASQLAKNTDLADEALNKLNIDIKKIKQMQEEAKRLRLKGADEAYTEIVRKSLESTRQKAEELLNKLKAMQSELQNLVDTNYTGKTQTLIEETLEKVNTALENVEEVIEKLNALEQKLEALPQPNSIRNNIDRRIRTYKRCARQT